MIRSGHCGVSAAPYLHDAGDRGSERDRRGGGRVGNGAGEAVRGDDGGSRDGARAADADPTLRRSVRAQHFPSVAGLAGQKVCQRRGRVRHVAEIYSRVGGKRRWLESRHCPIRGSCGQRTRLQRQPDCSTAAGMPRWPGSRQSRGRGWCRTVDAEPRSLRLLAVCRNALLGWVAAEPTATLTGSAPLLRIASTLSVLELTVPPSAAVLADDGGIGFVSK